MASARHRDHNPLLTDEEEHLLEALERSYSLDEAAADPLPLIGLAQLYRRDIPDLPAGPDDCELLQVFWCPFDAHGSSGYSMHLDLRWRRSSEVAEVLTAPPQPQVVGFEGYVPEPCVLYPEQVFTYPFAGLLPADLSARIYAWEEAEEANEDEEPPGYQYDLSIPPGWRVGGFASWHSTDPSPMDCPDCTTPMHLLLSIDSSEWDGGSESWRPLEEAGLPPHPYARPTEVTVGRWGELNIFACPKDPDHPHRWSLQ